MQLFDYIFNVGGNYTATINGMTEATGRFNCPLFYSLPYLFYLLYLIASIISILYYYRLIHTIESIQYLFAPCSQMTKSAQFRFAEVSKPTYVFALWR